MTLRRVVLLLLGLAAVLFLLALIVSERAELSAERQRVLAWNTLRLAASVSLLATPLGLLVALSWLKTDLPLRRTSLVVLVTLMFLPLYVQASAWQAGFGELGWYSVGNVSNSRQTLTDWQAAVWVHVAQAVPWATLIIGIGLSRVSRESEEAALLDGGVWRVVGWITIPQLWPWIVIAAVWVGISAANEMVVVDQFRIDTYARHLFTTFAQEASAADTYLILAPTMLALLLIGIALALAAMHTPPGMSDLYVPARRYKFGIRKWVLGLVVLSIIFFLSAVPLGNLFYQVAHRTGANGSSRWSLASAVAVMAQARFEFADELKWTVVISSLSATASLVAAIFASSVSRGRWSVALAFWSLAAVLLSIPAPMIGLWLFPVLNLPGWDFLYRLHTDTVFSPIVATAMRSWPILFVLCWFAERDISRDVTDHAALDRATFWQRILYIDLPLSWRAWLLCWLVGFALASGELAATQMVIPPGAYTVATRIFGLIHTGVREKEAALCLWHAGVCAILTWIALRLNEQRAALLRDRSRSGPETAKRG